MVSFDTVSRAGVPITLGAGFFGVAFHLAMLSLAFAIFFEDLAFVADVLVVVFVFFEPFVLCGSVVSSVFCWFHYWYFQHFLNEDRRLYHYR